MYGRSTWQAWRILQTLPSSTGRTPRISIDSPLACRLFQRGPFPRTDNSTPRAAFVTFYSRQNGDNDGALSSSPTTKEAQERIQELKSSSIPLYPRYRRSPEKRSYRSLQDQVIDGNDGLPTVSGDVEVTGRISTIRISSARLAFLDIIERQTKLQVMLDLSALTTSGVGPVAFRAFCRLLRRGDHISVRGGEPYKSKTGALTIRATSLPVVQSPCLQRYPTIQLGSATTELGESNYQPRHVEMLADPEVIKTFKIRSTVIREVRRFFESREFYEVSTPILSATAGGATAKAFETTATEFADRKLSLRIAPELWLKRLIIGGMDKIFEIGPSFRNEGLDKTHNPEFTTCEFYAVSHHLPRLMKMTEELLRAIAGAVEPYLRAPQVLQESIRTDFQVLDFIPALEGALGVSLPNLSSPAAHSELLNIFRSKDIPLPSHPTIPRLVDKLSSTYLEPQSSDKPLWIVGIPECLSPLAKSFIHPTAPNEQSIAARAELFIRGKEVVNCYEEENSPFEQRRKFAEQQRYARAPANGDDTTASGNEVMMGDEEAMKVDEDYLQALEWGLPPTGGWGCGIDRLVMLFADRERIGDVLSFGNLRAVTRGAQRVEKAN